MEGNNILQNSQYNTLQTEETQPVNLITNAPKINPRDDIDLPTPFILNSESYKSQDSKNDSFEIDLNSFCPLNKDSLLDCDYEKRKDEKWVLNGSRKNSQISTGNVTRDSEYTSDVINKDSTILSYLAKKLSI